MSKAKNPESLPKPAPSIDTPEGVRDVLARAEAGDAGVLALVRKLFDHDRAEGGRLSRSYGTSYQHTRNELTRPAAGNNLVAQETFTRKIDAVRDELAGPTPSPLERILCERVALCWYDAHEMDRRFSDQSNMSFKATEYRESRRDRAHKRFLAACRTLATVRKLALPAIQVNLAHQQVNVAGPS